ncbi:MAG: hypothetical protein A3D92_21715 [Bacteroidetes bacterium RIFCSPHIGHO2_02_FULL_44_7]|nr:MAG: hypothetical protein A3D92_21715 [Bacteroidetes bacterium RIFCSPHIGHO2_02_FULL_44_7]
MAISAASTDTNFSIELRELEEKGNLAIRSGRFDECLAWYMKGLTRAKELKKTEEAKKFSLLLATLL